MDDGHELTCQFCNSVGEAEEFDGKYYCRNCGEQNLDVVDTATDVGAEAGSAGVYLLSHQRRVTAPINAVPISHFKSQSNLIDKLGLADKISQPNDPFKVKLERIDESQFDGTNPSIPADFGGSKVVSFEDYINEIRLRYVLGLQMMIELQCEALVREFKVTPLICGLVGPTWLRFVSKTGVFDDDWADQVIHDSEVQQEGEPEEDYKSRAKYKAEPRNMFGQRAVLIWFRSLKKRIPLVCTVVISYLACHIAREAILPSDMIEWTLEGKLPYFSAFVEIEKRIGLPSIACPISSSFMFRPQRAFSVQKLESSAASVAQLLGLELPPVNFYALAYRYLEKLSLPVEKILPFACRIYEWTMSPDLWLSLSKDYFRLPTHVCVVSILVVAIRILYNINGNGEWEKSLSHNSDSANDNDEKDTTFAIHDEHCFGNYAVGRQKPELDSTGLLQHLHAIYNEIEGTREYSKDLPTYLKYCRDVVFAGLEPSYGNHEEQNMMDNLWNFYQNEENSKPPELEKQHNNSFNQTGLRDEGSVRRTPKKQKSKRKCFNEPSPDEDICLESDFPGSLSNDDSFESLPDDEDSDSNEGDKGSGNSVVKEAIRELKLDMEENRFCYLPPNVKSKKFGYVHYIRKKDKGALIYVAHADYYILLRACARVAHDDIRILHIGVLSLERRLAWLEKRIHRCLHLKPPKISCQFCSTRATENGSDDVHVPELSNLTI